MNIFYFILFMIIGIVMVAYSGWITDNTSRIEYAEKYLGAGGTYTFWKILGVVSVVLSFWILFK